MHNPTHNVTMAAIRAGDEALDRGLRGPSKEIALLKNEGLLIAPLPKEVGGRGWGTSHAGAFPMCDLLMTLGSASLPIARIYEGHVNAVKLVTTFGTPAQLNSIAAAIHDGALMGVWGADSATPVVLDIEQEMLTGRKAFASGLGDVQIGIVTARSNQGTYMVIVDANDIDRAYLEEWDVAAMVGSQSGGFDCVNLPAEPSSILGGANDIFAEPIFHGGIWRLTACYAGALCRIAHLLSVAVRCRVGVSATLSEQRVAHVAVEAETASLWARHACQLVEQEGSDANLAVQTVLFARQAIEAASERAIVITERAMGTAAFHRASEIGRLMRDLRFYLRQADLDGKLTLATTLWRQKHDDLQGTGCSRT